MKAAVHDMPFHHYGYVTGDPRMFPAAGERLTWTDDLPEAVDVLIVGAGPAGMITAAQLSRFPGICTRVVERRAGRLEIGHADGLQARSLETFQAFGFADRLSVEAAHVAEIAFWRADPADPSRIVRVDRTVDDPSGLSEFPHILVNQARVLDYFAEYLANAPTRMRPDYAVELLSLTVDDEADYPIAVSLARTDGDRRGRGLQVRARYVVGADGAHSTVRASIGRRFEGDRANHAWAVLDVLAVTDFPDIRMLSTVHSGSGGNIMIIPREGGFLVRLYVDLGEVDAEGAGHVRETPAEQAIAKVNAVIRPYSIDVKSIAWYSVYEVGHRLADRFDDLPVAEAGSRTPRVFILGDACHTHSAKGGQGMNVSLQDGFNLGWKLGHVLEGRSSEALLSTYTSERRAVAEELIRFDKAWSSLMARKSEEFDDSAQLPRFFIEAEEFRSGFKTEYPASMITAEPRYQGLATGFPIGRRFHSARVVRVADANIIHLGHRATADGRWRIYVFADEPAGGESSAVREFGDWLVGSAQSPFALVPAGLDPHVWFDVVVVYQQHHHDVEFGRVPAVFRPTVGPFQLTSYDHVFATLEKADIFAQRGVDRAGVTVIVRPDQYVADVAPLTATDELARFFHDVSGR